MMGNRTDQIWAHKGKETQVEEDSYIHNQRSIKIYIKIYIYIFFFIIIIIIVIIITGLSQQQHKNNEVNLMKQKF